MYKGIIYKYTSPSGKVYIGQTNQEKKRKYRFLNIKQSYGSPKIDNARKKYGPNFFKYEVLFEYYAENEDDLRKILGEKEIFFIKEYNSIKKGYNHQEGGIHKINIINPESRRKAALKISKKVLQYSLDGKFIQEWSSTMDIERNLNIHHSLISSNCSMKTKHCRDYIFKYKVKDIIDMEININSPIKIHKTKHLKIGKFDLNGIEIKNWKSITNAAFELNIDRHKLKNLTITEQIYDNFIYKIIE